MKKQEIRTMKRKRRGLFYLIRKTFAEWSEDKASSLAAALAYYTTFSLAPMLVVLIAIAGLFGGAQVIHGYIMDQVNALLGPDGGAFVSSMIENASHVSTGIIATILGLITLLIGSLGVFGELQSDLNTIWDVKPKPVKGLVNNVQQYVLKRVLSFAMLMVILFLLLISLVVSAAFSALGNFLGNTFLISDLMLQILNFAIPFVLITLLFAMIYRYLPDAKVRWRDIWLGAAVTSLLFSFGKFVIGLYLGKSSVSSTFGAAGSLAILLVWVYYSSQIVFLGAEFTQVFANEYGAGIVPEEHAVKIIEEKYVQEAPPVEAPQEVPEESHVHQE
jgi:membrane protein